MPDAPQLPAPDSPAPLAPGYYYAPEPEYEQPGVPLSHYLWVLRRHRYKILAFVAACVFGTWVVSSRLTPIYEATATVDVDPQAPIGVVGQDAQRTIPNYNDDQFLATQVKLVQSDAVLRPVVEKYKLVTYDQKALERRKVSNSVAANAPVGLGGLNVKRTPNTYLVLISYRSPNPTLAADVSNAVAQSYLEHTYNIRIRSSASLATFMEKQLEELRAKMERSSEALMKFEREMNLINPEEKTNILSARLLQLNTEYTNAQGDRVRREVAYQSARSGTLEAAMTAAQGEMLRKLMEQLNDAQQKFSAIDEQYGARHPEYRKAAAQVAELKRQVDAARQAILKRIELDYNEAVRRETMLQKAVAETKSEYDKINANSFQYQQLKQEADADKQLYEELVRKIREAGINAGFQNNVVRLADVARPPLDPVFPDMRLNLMLAFLLSAIVAVGVAVMSDAMDKSIRDPQQIEQTLKTQVIGSLPMVRGKPLRLLPEVPANGNGNGNGTALVHAGEHANGHHGRLTLFEESVRTLHSAILLGELDREIHSLLVTSTAPGEGKTTTAAHLAVSNSAQGRPTLLIDADLRRPSLHRTFDVFYHPGLSNVLMGEVGWREAVVTLEHHPNLALLPSGPTSRRAPDLIGRGLEELLEEARREFSLIVLDSPPFLNFAEPLRMSTMVDGVLVVTVAGETNRHATASALATLGRVRANVVGLVLNKVTRDLMENYYYYGYYGYHGKYKDFSVLSVSPW